MAGRSCKGFLATNMRLGPTLVEPLFSSAPLDGLADNGRMGGAALLAAVCMKREGTTMCRLEGGGGGADAAGAGAVVAASTAVAAAVEEEEAEEEAEEGAVVVVAVEDNRWRFTGGSATDEAVESFNTTDTSAANATLGRSLCVLTFFCSGSASASSLARLEPTVGLPMNVNTEPVGTTGAGAVVGRGRGAMLLRPDMVEADDAAVGVFVGAMLLRAVAGAPPALGVITVEVVALGVM